MVMGAALVPALFIESAPQFPLLFSFFLLHTLAAATQDVSIDALCIAEVEPEERSVLNGWMQAGMLIGRSLFGGGAILFLQYFEMKTILGALIGLIWGTTIILFFSEQQSSIGTASINDRRKIFWDVLKHALSSRAAWLGMLFAVIGGTAYESVGAVAGPFFVDNGFSKDQIGTFFSIFSIAAMLLGALIGGYGGKRYGIKRSVAVSLSFIIIMVFTLASYHIPHQSPGDPIYFIIMTAVYLGIGMFTASSYALFMNITDARLGATQFSTYMGGTNICESWSGYTAGILIAAAGYSAAFYSMGIVSLISLAVLYFIPEKNNSETALE
jgi:MFS family permease